MPRKQRNDGQQVNGSSTAASNDGLEKFVERIEKLEPERRDTVYSMNEVLLEAADRGFPKRALKEVVKRRLETAEAQTKRIDHEEALDALLSRLGMLAGTPLGDASVTHLRPQQ